MTVDILVGLDAYWKFMVLSYVVQADGLVAQESVFGWVLSGLCTVPARKENVSSQLMCINNVPESDLHNLWNLESMGICNREDVPNDIMHCNTLKKNSEKACFKEGKYEVALPWKSDAARLSLKNNEQLARRGLEYLGRKFDKNPSLRKRYDEVFVNYEKEGIIEEVPQSEIVSSYPTYYLPQQPVVRENSVSTKVRKVFDA